MKKKLVGLVWFVGLSQSINQSINQSIKQEQLLAVLLGSFWGWVHWAGSWRITLTHSCMYLE
jgi:formate-dependent nitrite reductase membrane component NrfD